MEVYRVQTPVCSAGVHRYVRRLVPSRSGRIRASRVRDSRLSADTCRQSHRAFYDGALMDRPWLGNRLRFLVETPAETLGPPSLSGRWSFRMFDVLESAP